MTTPEKTEVDDIESKTIEVDDIESKTIEVDDVELKTIELRLNSVKEATQRSRAVFVIMTLTCAIILFGLWNAIVSWDRGVATKEREGSTTVQANQKAVTEEWFKNLIISVGFLGIRVSVNDLAVIGSSSLIVIMVWYFFCQRRENRAIVSLIRYCYEGSKNKELSKDVCNLVYEGIVQSIVFIDMGGGDNPIIGFGTGNLIKFSSRKNSSIKLRHKIRKFIRIRRTSKIARALQIREILKFLAYLPPFTILMIIIADIVSLFMSSYIRPCFATVFSILWQKAAYFSMLQIISFETFAVFCLIYTTFICRKCRMFSNATSRTIKEFKKEVLEVSA